MAGKRIQTSPVGSPLSDRSSREPDRFLPIANVGRIMKKSLPSNAKISKEAKESVQEYVSEFISFITGEASEKCQREKRKTINGDDLLWAMTTLGFENYVGTLRIYLNKYRETEGDKNTVAVQEGQIPISSIGNNEFQSFGAQVNTKAYLEQGETIGCEEDHLAISSNINIGKLYEHGNARRAMATHFHRGVEW